MLGKIRGRVRDRLLILFVRSASIFKLVFQRRDLGGEMSNLLLGSFVLDLSSGIEVLGQRPRRWRSVGQLLYLAFQLSDVVFPVVVPRLQLCKLLFVQGNSFLRWIKVRT